MKNNHKRTITLLILFFKIIGVFPFGYSENPKTFASPRNHFYFSVTTITYNLILIGLVCSLYIKTAIVDPNLYIKQLTENPLSDIEVNLASVVLIILWMGFPLYRHDVIELLRKLSKIIELLENHRTYWARCNERKFVITIISYISLWIIIGWFAYDAWDPGEWTSSGWYGVYMFAKFVMATCILKYTLLCFMIKNMAECLNTILANFPCPSPKIQHFKNIRAMYRLVWNFARSTDQLYGGPILIIIMYSCWGVTYTLSMMTLDLKNGDLLRAILNERQFYLLNLTIVFAMGTLVWSTTAAIDEVFIIF